VLAFSKAPEVKSESTSSLLVKEATAPIEVTIVKGECTMYETMNRSHTDAMDIINAIRAKLEADRKAACVAGTDSHGELISFLRMDGCHLPPLDVAINKAFTAARERKPSSEVGKASFSAPFPMSNFGDPRCTGWAGGFPVLHQGKVVGAVGVSGLTEEQDAELGRMAVELVTRKAAG
jgi:glc operon protein GlcG